MQATLVGLYDIIYENENFLVLFLLPESCYLHKYILVSPLTHVQNIHGVENLIQFTEPGGFTGENAVGKLS